MALRPADKALKNSMTWMITAEKIEVAPSAIMLILDRLSLAGEAGPVGELRGWRVKTGRLYEGAHETFTAWAQGGADEELAAVRAGASWGAVPRSGPETDPAPRCTPEPPPPMIEV